MKLVLVMAGGAVGAGARHLAGRASFALVGPGLPWAPTLFANVVGGALMGLLAGTLARVGGSDDVRLLLGVGVLGGFTTFSSFSLDMALMVERGAVGTALLYALASVAGALAALFAGLAAARVIA